MKRVGQLALCLIVIAGALALLGPYQPKLADWFDGVVARIDGKPITQRDLALAVREHLWRHGESWDALGPEAQQTVRETVLLQVIDQHLIHEARLGQPQMQVPTEEELHWFQRQLGFAENRYTDGLQQQELTEAQLRNQMQSQLEDQAWLDARLAVSVATIGDAQARQWFEAHRVQAAKCYRAAHLFLTRHEPGKPDRSAEIQSLAAQLNQGASFEALVAAHSDDERTKGQGGDLGWFAHERMPEDFMAAVAKLEPGLLSEPIATQLGWHLIKLIERKEARLLSFEEVREEVLARLRYQQREAALQDLLKALRAKAKIEPFKRALASSQPAS